MNGGMAQRDEPPRLNAFTSGVPTPGQCSGNPEQFWQCLELVLTHIPWDLPMWIARFGAQFNLYCR